MTRLADFAVVGVDRYELGIAPLRHTLARVVRQGSAHPGLSEAERRICVAA